MQNIVYTKYSIDRDNKFKIRTDILMDENGKKSVRKKAYSDEAQEHIYKIHSIYNKLKSFYSKDDIDINECFYDGKYVEFPFIEGNTFEQILDELLEKNEVNKVLAHIKLYCDKIRENAHTGFNKADEFVTVFGDFYFDDSVKCVNVADVDLLFPNIIVNDKWNIIDYEWTFFFDVPVDFIIYRALSNYINGMFGGSTRDELKKIDIYSLVDIDLGLIGTFREMDRHFSEYVIGSALTGRELQELVGKPVIDVKKLVSEHTDNLSARVVQVFYDKGNGFCEADCEYIMPSWDAKDQINLTINVPDGCDAIRIDPMIGCGFFELEKIQLDESDAEFEANGLRTGNIISFYNDDPQIIIRNTKKTSKLILKGKVVFSKDFIVDEIRGLNDKKEKEIISLIEQRESLVADIQSLIEQRDMLGKDLQSAIEQRDELDIHCQAVNKRITYLEDEVTSKNNHINNLQVQLYHTNQERHDLAARCNQLELELNQNIFIRLLKSNRVTLKIGKGIKFFLRNGFKPTFQVIKAKINKRFSKKFNKEKIVLNASSTTVGNNVYDITNLNESTDFNKSIAVHLHLFYFDLLPEFIWYLNNIPYKFDLYISCQIDGPVKKITKMAKKIKNVNQVIVKECQNRGRDIAPLYVWFREEIEKYDFFLHMHSKKSLYTGTEKVGWRQMSLDSLLGSEEVVRKIFGMFTDNEKIGLVYPEYYIDFCKFHCSWLTNDIIGREFLDKLDIEQDKMMFNYPAGSFFWARTEAVRPLFDMKLEIEDFPEEQGQTDTTLAHVLERAIACVAEDRGYYGALIDLDEGVVRARTSLKLFRDYMDYSVDDAINEVKVFDAVSFDIFGTLIINKAYNRTTFFEYIQSKHDDIVQDYDFVLNRKLAEKDAIKEFGDRTTLADIYVCLAKRINISEELAKIFMEYENQALIELCVQREDVYKIYDAMVYRDKKIVFVDDTYYSAETVKNLLWHCGYNKFDDLWLSCEKGKRKDKDELWDDFFEAYSDINIVHVGDNPRSDWQTVYDRGKNAFWVMNGYDEFCMSKYYEEYKDMMDENFDNAMKLGEIINEKFNSPFALNGPEGNQ